MAKKVKILLALFVVLGVVWSGLWFAASLAAEVALTKVEERSVASGNAVNCQDQQISGYPFHMQVQCKKAVFSSVSAGVSAAIDSVKSVALLYKPGHVIAEADGPLTVQLPQSAILKGSVAGTWDSARASVSAGISGLKRASVVGQQVNLVFDEASGSSLLDGVKLKDIQLHVRPDTQDAANFDLAFNATDLVVERANRAMPSMRLLVLAKAINVGESIDFDVETLLFAWLEQGGDLEIENAQFDSLGFTAKASGPIKISIDGLLSGKVKVELLNLETLPDLVAEIAPNYRSNAEQLASTLKGFTAANPDEPVTVNLLINNGLVSAGILPIGKIPPLF